MTKGKKMPPEKEDELTKAKEAFDKAQADFDAESDVYHQKHGELAEARDKYLAFLEGK